jgi:hypothetical protein
VDIDRAGGGRVTRLNVEERRLSGPDGPHGEELSAADREVNSAQRVASLRPRGRSCEGRARG